MVRAALTALVATGMVVVATPETGSALPGNCTHTFIGVSGGSWETTTNWTPNGIPDASNAVACIPANKVVLGPSFRTVNQLHLDAGSAVDLAPRQSSSTALSLRRHLYQPSAPSWLVRGAWTFTGPCY